MLHKLGTRCVVVRRCTAATALVIFFRDYLRLPLNSGKKTESIDAISEALPFNLGVGQFFEGQN